MTRREWLRMAGLAAMAPLVPGRAAMRHPNILLVLADDLDYGDLRCYGNQVNRTRNLDSFAAESLRFTNCYAAGPVCSPSRAALLTGRTPTRLGIHAWIPMLSPMHLRSEEVTIAKLLQNAGYATCHIGKWHLNGMFNLPGQPQPSDHGFDYWFSTQNNALPNHHNPYNFVRNGIPVGPQEGYTGQIVAREAIRWLKDGRDKSRPFFQFVCFHETHEPIATDPQFSGLFPSTDPSYSIFHGNVTQMHDAFGQLTQALEELNLRENTVFFFTSDNGPARTSIHPHGSAGPLRGKKGHLYEGGIRVPGLLRWPGRAPAAETCDEPVSGVDWLPTLCEITGVSVPAHRAIDGTSFLPTLERRPIRRHTPLYRQYNAAQSKSKVAMRAGEWKILGHLSGPGVEPGGSIRTEDQQAIKTAELVEFELYYLGEDVGEADDRSTQEPELSKEMIPTLRKLYREVRDESPVWPAWEFARYESERIEWPAYSRRSRARK